MIFMDEQQTPNQNPSTPQRQEELSREQRREEARKRFEEEKKKAAENREKTKSRGQYMKYAIFGIIVGVFVLGGFFLFGGNQNNSGNPTGNASLLQSVHWHAYPEVVVCGEKKVLPFPATESQHVGSGLLHTHKSENWIHMEGTLDIASPPKLAEYFKNIGVEFSSERLAWKAGNGADIDASVPAVDKKNGDDCNGSVGKWKMLVNGKESEDWGGHRIFDGEKYRFEFS